MKSQLKKMKSELKALAKEIRYQKSIRKLKHPEHEKYTGHQELSCVYRHKHVAYCLARGRTLEQIDSGHKLDMELVRWYQEQLNPESKEKLYVVVDGSLSPSQQAVQAGHAIASFLKSYPDTLWQNGYLVYLKEENTTVKSGIFFKKEEKRGVSIHWRLRYSKFHQCAVFQEPDLGGITTAYAVFGPQAAFALKDYKLV
jgi:hypothetical protein